MIISAKSIHEGEHVMAAGRVHKCVNTWEGEFIFRERLVIIQAYADLLILFHNRDNIGGQGGPLDRFDKPSFE